MRPQALILLTFAVLLLAQDRPSSCKSCPTWNIEQTPFRIHGDTYYVGPHGLGAILITSPSGHILIDGALPESVPRIVASIKTLGFKVEDVKLIVNTHVHFDHGGGIAELEMLSGARVAASKWTADAMTKGAVPRDDPQFGAIIPSPRVAKVKTFKDGETLRAGGAAITAHLTPGHTSGGTSWTWRSCEDGRCLDLVYADSLTPVSADGFRFTDNKELLAGFERSFAFLERTPCDILITPHPDFSNLWERLEARKSKPDAMIDRAACRALAASSRERLKKRLAVEAGK